MVKLRYFLAFYVVSLCVAGCGTPTEPDWRPGVLYLNLSCTGDGSAPMTCRAVIKCSGYCTTFQGDRDITATAVWGVEGVAARHVANGDYEAIGIGDVVVTAVASDNSTFTATRTATVFSGHQPLPTGRLRGLVGVGTYQATPFGPQPVYASYIDGATVEILDGVAAGRRETTGQSPAVRPGFGVPLPIIPGGVEFQGIPAGRYELEVRAPGRAPVRAVVTESGSFYVVLP